MSVRKGQSRLRQIAKLLESNSPLPDEHRIFLAVALKAISEGVGAEFALEVKARRGERKSKHSRESKYSMEFIYGWIAIAILPEGDELEGGLGLPLDEACKQISKNMKPEYRLSAETIRRYWDKNKTRYSPHFYPADFVTD